MEIHSYICDAVYGTHDKIGNVGRTHHWGAFVQPLLPYKSKKYYIFWVCACSFSYPACSANESYCHLWSVRLYKICPHYLI